MHFGEFNPLEVLAAAAVQRGGNSQEGSSEGTDQGQSSTSDATENDDNPDDSNRVAERKDGVTEMDCANSDSSKSNERDPVVTNEANTTSTSVIKETEGRGNKNLNPLSVVTSSSSDGLAKNSTNTPSYVIKMVTSNGNKVGSSRSMMALKDATKIIIPNKDGSSKTLTVLKINKPVSSRTSSSLQILNDKPKGEDDEGYCSRSSLDSPGQCSRSDSELCEQENADLKSPIGLAGKSTSPLNVRVIPMAKSDGDLTKVNKNLTNRMLSPGASLSDQPGQTAKKPAKIVIVSRDTNIKNMFSDSNNEKPLSDKSSPQAEPVVSSPQGGTVLRSLLGEKSVNTETLQSSGISPTNVLRDNKIEFTPDTGIPEMKSVSRSASEDSKSSKSATGDQISAKLGSQHGVSGIDTKQGTVEELKLTEKNCINVDYSSDCGESSDKVDSPVLDTNSNCLSSSSSASCDIVLDQGFKVPSNVDTNSVKSEPKVPNNDENKFSTIITRSSENTSCTTPSTVVRIVCANKVSSDDGSNDVVNKTPVLGSDHTGTPCGETETESDKNSELIKTSQQECGSTNSTPGVSECDENSQQSESFQNAFKSFLTNGQPVDSSDLNGLKASSSTGDAVILPQSVLSSLNSQSKVTVVAGGPASQLVTSLASQVLATSHTSQLPKATLKQTVLNQPTVVVDCKEDEEIVDVTSLGEVPSSADSKESLKLVSSLNQTPVTSVVKSIPANNNVSLFTSAISSSKGNAAAKTIPVLINTTNGKRLASVPVTTLVSASTGQSQKPVTYLVMPPQGKGGASLLLPQQFRGQNTLQAAAQGLSNIPKYQYIIQDDVPPVIQPNSAPATQQPQTMNLLNIGKPPTSDSWTVLATVDTQGVVSTPGQTTIPNMSKSKTVPVLIKKPIGSDLSLNTSVLHNSIVVSSKGPQSLIPKLMGQPVYQSQKSVSHSKLLVNPNDILKTDCTSPFSESVVKLKNQTTSKSCDRDKDLKSALEVSDHLGESFMDSNLVQAGIDSSQLLDNSGSDMLKIERTPSKTQTPSTGRGTPSITGRITPLHSLETAPSENTINIKITGSKVIDMRTSEDLSRATKKQAHIGKFGSLSTSWSGLQKSESVPVFGKSGIGGVSTMSSPVMFDSATTSPTSSVEPWSPNPMSPLQIRSDSELDLELLARPRPKAVGETKSQAAGRRKLRGSTSSTPDLSLIKESQGVSRLHPLIDHDYCMFSEFSADIQSSIIATTESKKKIEKYNQKAKAARTKESVFKVEKSSLKMKKRKYTHRLPLEELRKIRQEKALERRSSLLCKLDNAESLLLSGNPGQSTKTIGKIDKPIVKRQAALDKKILSTKPKRRDNKNYVKITGSFQDDFVYYATKNTRGRPRKYHDSTSPQMPTLPTVPKKQPVAGINIFDWYRDLSKTDKSSKFGVPEDPLQVSGQEVKTDPYVNGITDKHLSISTMPSGGHTPVHESEVADLVMQMMPNTEYNTGITSGSDHFVVTSSQSVAQSETVVASNEEREGQKTELVEHVLTADEENPADLENMVEQVRSMLNSMGEAELTMLSENLSHSIPSSVQSENIKESGDVSTSTSSTTTAVADATDYSSLNAFLGPYSQGSSTVQGTTNSFDLDDINDSDLLPSDIGNMNMILGDLNTPKTSTSNSTVDPKLSMSALDSPVKSSAPLSLLFSDSPIRPAENAKQEPTLTSAAIETENIQNNIDKSELFLEVGTPMKMSEDQGQSAQQITVEKQEEVQRPPELTTVSMFWNDLPGLMIHAKQCVRLVDIHKQMLPAKDTGILKKRCQMMNLEITNCSELERDFLIRYANAAKSKSCVVVAKEDAQALVSFYVNPRPRVSSVARQSTGDSRESSAERPPDRAAEDLGPPTPATVCSEYDPELDSTPSPKCTGGKGKGKGKSSRPHSASSERASTPSASGKGKGKGGGKGAQKRKLSPQLDLVTQHVTVASFTEALPSVASEDGKPVCELSHPSTPQPLVTPGNANENMFVTPDPTGIKRSERTRNRKVNYAALNSGMYEEGMVVAATSQLETQELTEDQLTAATKNIDNNNHKIIKVGSSLLNRVVLIKNSPVLKTNAMTNMTVAPVEGQVNPENRYNFQEEIEIRRLRNKQKRRGLNNAEKKKLKRLRERLRVKVKNLKRKIDNLKKNNGLVMSPKKILVKNMDNSETRAEIGENPDAAAIATASLSTPDVHEPVSLLACANTITKNDSHEVSGSVESQLQHSEPSVVERVELLLSSETSQKTQLTVTPEAICRSSNSSATSSSAGTVEKCNKEAVAKPKKKEITQSRHRMPLRKVIFPVLHRSNQRGRMQVGNLHFHLYRSRESTCIQCTTCSDFLSVRKFLKHMHHHNMKDELCTVTLPHKLEMAVLEPSADQTHWWGEFQKKRTQFEASPLSSVKTASRTDQRKVSSSRETPVTPVSTDVVTELPQGGSAGEVYCVKVEHPGSSQARGGGGSRATTQGIVLSSPTASSPGLHLVKVESQTTRPANTHPVSVLNVSSHEAIQKTGSNVTSIVTTPAAAAGTRQSTRVRKRKQLHPIESYVYSNKSSTSETASLLNSKRLKTEEGFVVKGPVSSVSSPECAGQSCTKVEHCENKVMSINKVHSSHTITGDNGINSSGTPLTDLSGDTEGPEGISEILESKVTGNQKVE